MRNEKLKVRISKYQEEKAKQEEAEVKKQKEEEEREKMREIRRQEYFERQKKNIEEFRMQKELTESLLMIAPPTLHSSQAAKNNNVSTSQLNEYRKSL